MSLLRETDVWRFIRRARSSTIPRSLWFTVGHLKAYVRAGRSYFPQGGEYGVAVATVDVEPASQGKGLFRAFLEKVEQEARTAGYSHIRVEQVANPILADMLARRQWKVYGEYPATFYKILD